MYAKLCSLKRSKLNRHGLIKKCQPSNLLSSEILRSCISTGFYLSETRDITISRREESRETKRLSRWGCCPTLGRRPDCLPEDPEEIRIQFLRVRPRPEIREASRFPSVWSIGASAAGDSTATRSGDPLVFPDPGPGWFWMIFLARILARVRKLLAGLHLVGWRSLQHVGQYF